MRPCRPGSMCSMWLILAGALLAVPGCGEDREEARAGAEATSEERGAAPRAGRTGADTTRADPVGGTVPAGTTFRVRLERTVGMSSREGDTLTAVTTAPLRGDGGTVVPGGATVHATVTAVQRPDGEGPGVLKLSFREIEVAGQVHPLYASVVDAEPTVQPRMEGATEPDAGDAAAGDTLIGRILSGEEEDSPLRETLRLADGTAIVLGTALSSATLTAGSEVELRLDEPLVTESAPGSSSSAGRAFAAPTTATAGTALRPRRTGG